MKKTILISLLSSGLLLSQTANAGDWAIGGIIGSSDVDGIGGSETAYGVNLSYNFNKAWGIELGYADLGDFGEDNVSTFVPGFGTVTTDVSVDVSALYLAGTGSYYFTDNWSLTGRLGITELNADISVSAAGINGSASDSSTVFVGASLNYNFSENVQAQARYDNFDEADSFTLGLRYSF